MSTTDGYNRVAVDFIRRELQMLWSDLFEAMRTGINTDWSIKCEGLGERIKEATAIVGPADWYDTVPTTLLVDGTYQKCLTRLGITASYPNDAQMDKLVQSEAKRRREFRERHGQR